MKKSTRNLAILSAFFLSTLVAASCKKNTSSPETTSTTVTTDDAADVVTSAVTPESGGMVAQTETTIIFINEGDLSCGIERDTTFTGSNISGAAITYNYGYASSRLLTCDNSLPSQFQFDFSGKTSYSAPRIASNDSSKGQFSVTGLQPAASQYVFNMSYVRNGSQTSKVHNQLTFTSTISISSTNVTIDKNSEQIVSGTANVTVSGSTTEGKSFSYSGTLTFSGSKQAVLVLGNGNSYTISWS